MTKCIEEARKAKKKKKKKETTQIRQQSKVRNRIYASHNFVSNLMANFPLQFCSCYRTRTGNGL
jgi:hypothetical protein